MNVLTFDIEDWFHLLDHDATRNESSWDKFEPRIYQSVERILELLVRHKIKATFFCLGWIARKYPDIIRRIDSLGFEIGSHSYAHQLAYDQTRQEFAEDLTRSIATIEQLIGKKVRAYRAPGFSFTSQNTWVFESLLQQGIELDSSIFPARRAHGGFPQFDVGEPVLIHYQGMALKEFPVSYTRVVGRKLVFSGGGYFRLFPYPIIRRWLNRSQYNMTYFHPRDFDSGQPRLKGLGLVRGFKSYHGLTTAFEKLERMLNDFAFVDLGTLDQSLVWNTRPVVKIS